MGVFAPVCQRFHVCLCARFTLLYCVAAAIPARERVVRDVRGGLRGFRGASVGRSSRTPGTVVQMTAHAAAPGGDAHNPGIRAGPARWSTRVWHGLADVRAGLQALDASIEPTFLDPTIPAVLAWARPHPEQTFVALHNVSTTHQWWPRGAVPPPDHLVDTPSGRPPAVSDDAVRLQPYAALWRQRAGG